MDISLLNTKTVPTVKITFNSKTIIFHSKYDPLHTSEKWAEKAVELIKPTEEVIVFGIGGGYHVDALAKILPNTQITVFEFNNELYDWFIYSSLAKLVNNHSNVTLKKFSLLHKDHLNNLLKTVISTNIWVLDHSLSFIEDKYQSIISILKKITLQNLSLTNQLSNMRNNFGQNIELKDAGLEDLNSKFSGRPMVLVSAGPSLSKQLPRLKEMQESGKFIIGAVGTAILPLYSFSIIPDFFAITDAQATTKQLEEVSLPNSLLFYLSTANTNTILLHGGPRRIVWQQGYVDAENMAERFNDPLIQTGGSVATTLLDIMVYLGGQTIALVGQDLAFTNGQTHAAEAHSNQTIMKNTHGSETIDYYQKNTVQTSENLNLYRAWFEDYALDHNHLNLINCTEGGAYIHNWGHMPLKAFHEKFI